jgi:hypothetical protein
VLIHINEICPNIGIPKKLITASLDDILRISDNYLASLDESLEA